jgi:hypothetical protein
MDLRRWWSEVLARGPDPPTFTRDELAGWSWGPAAGANRDPYATAEREAVRAKSGP